MVLATVGLFLLADRVATRLGSVRPVFHGFLVTTCALTILGVYRSGPEALGSYPGQTASALIPRVIVSLLTMSVFVGGIAAVLRATQGKPLLARIGGSTAAGLVAGVAGAFVGQFASCILGVGCI